MHSGIQICQSLGKEPPPARRQVDALLLEKPLMVRDSVGFTAITPTLGQRRLSFPLRYECFLPLEPSRI